MGNPLIPPPFLKTKLLSQRAVAIIFVERKLLQAITTPFLHHFPWKFDFWPFLAIYHHLCLCMGDPLISPPLSLTKMLSPGAVAMITMERELLQSIMPPFAAISPKIEFLVIFRHFSPFVLAYGQSLDPVFTFIDQNVITGCCCNDIYGERATLGYYHPIFPPYAWKLNFWSFLAIFHHLSLLMGDPMTPSPLLEKNVITGHCCNDIYQKKACQSHHRFIFPPNSCHYEA